MAYILPVDRPRYGWKHGQRSLTWPGGHPGVDLLPTIPRDRQNVKAPASGTLLNYVGGACQGFDWQATDGLYHRFCHLDIFVKPGQKFTKGQIIAQMAPKGLLVPPGTTHLHWVSARDRNLRQQLDPLTLVSTEPDLYEIHIPSLFKQIWGRQGAPGDILVFETERKQGKYRTYHDLVNTMTYWFQQVYPDGIHLSHLGDAKWQRKKEKVLL